MEVLAYGLRLLEMRLAAVGPAYPDGLAGQVRRECSVLVGQAGWRRRNRFKRLPAPDPGLGGSRYAQLYPARNGDSQGQARLTREMFEQFCHCTGLGSEVLVGTGENLASLVFYIAVHSVRSARGLPTREEVLRLLRAASECRIQMQRAISRWLAAESSSPPRPGGRPPPSGGCPASRCQRTAGPVGSLVTTIGSQTAAGNKSRLFCELARGLVARPGGSHEGPMKFPCSSLAPRIGFAYATEVPAVCPNTRHSFRPLS